MKTVIIVILAIVLIGVSGFTCILLSFIKDITNTLPKWMKEGNK